MRPIKFRGLNKPSGEWKYGYLVVDEKYTQIWQEGNVPVVVERETVGEYTGLKDKNRKEIYEGDIIEVWGRKDYLQRIVFEFGSFVTKSSNEKIGDGCGGSLWNNKEHIENDCKIIGNIYENKELLK